MSTQLTWLATNIVAPGNGVPKRRRRKPKIHASPADQARTARSPRPSLPQRIERNGGARHSRVNGSGSRMCSSSSGVR